jgi:hypothetical protein
MLKKRTIRDLTGSQITRYWISRHPRCPYPDLKDYSKLMAAKEKTGEIKYLVLDRWFLAGEEC